MNLKKILAMFLVMLIMLGTLTACDISLNSILGIADEEDDTPEDIESSTQGGESVVLPENFIMPEVANTISGMLVEGTDEYVGVIYLSNYRSDTYLFINGNSLTIDGNFYLTDANADSVDADPDYRDVKVTLWEKGPNQAE